MAKYTTPQRDADTTMIRVPAPTVLILAAGEGTRMKSDLPKVLHPICGRPMILWPILAPSPPLCGYRRWLR